MMGRYGVDQMNIGVLIFSMVCTFTASLTRWLLLLKEQGEDTAFAQIRKELQDPNY